MGLSGRQWSLLIVVSAGLVAAGVSLGFAAQHHKFQAVAGGLIAPLALLISLVALTMSASQTLSASRQAKSAGDQVRYSAEQTRLAALATAYSYRPILLPVHDAVPVQVYHRAEPSYPAVEAFTVAARAPGQAAFLVDGRQGQAEISVRNVGRGPALLLGSSLIDASGRTAELDGNPAIGPDGQERYSATFVLGSTAQRAFVGPQSPRLRVTWQELIDDQRSRERAFVLLIHYVGVAPEARVDTLEAVFDPRGTGGWKVSIDTEKTPVTGPGPGPLA